jgi:hypothetical protein
LKPIETTEAIEKNQLEELHQILLKSLVGCAQSLDLPFCFVDSKDADKAIKIDYRIALDHDRYRFWISVQDNSDLGFVEQEVFIDPILINKGLYRPFVEGALGHIAIRFLHKAVPSQSEED